MKKISYSIVFSFFSVLVCLQLMPADFVYRHFVASSVWADITDLTATTGLIGKEDIAFGTGENTDTFSVVVYNGSTVALTKLPSFYANVASIIKGRWYVAAQSGDQCDPLLDGSLAWITDTIGTDPTTIELPGNQTYTCSTNYEIPSTTAITYQMGAKWSIDNGVTITHSGVIDAGSYQIFSGDGSVTFASGQEIGSSWRNDLAALVADISATTVTLKIDGTENIPDGETVNTHANTSVYALNGGVIDTNATGAVVFGGPFDGDLSQHFDTSGGGTVTFSTPGDVYPEWWKQNTTPGTTDMTSAFLAAYNACFVSGGKIKLSSTIYGLIDLVFDPGVNGNDSYAVNIEGAVARHGWYSEAVNSGTVLKALAGAAFVIQLGSDDNNLNSTVIENVVIDGNGKASDGLRLRRGQLTTLRNCGVVACIRGIAVGRGDRLTLDRVKLDFNTYGVYKGTGYVSEATGANLSGVSFIDVHNRGNDYNFYDDELRDDVQISIRGGYWASALYNDIYAAGINHLSIDGANFEEPAGAFATKSSIIKIGVAHSGIHVGISSLSITNSLYFDNNILAERIPRFVEIIDSGSATYPSLISFNFGPGNSVYNAASGFQICDATTTSQLSNGSIYRNYVDGNNGLPTIGVPWLVVERGDLTGYNLLDTVHISGQSALFSVVFNRTTDFTLRKSEAGKTVTNDGAGTLTLTMPADPVDGWYFIILSSQASIIDLLPHSGATILGTSGVGTSARLAAGIGNSLRIQWVKFPTIGGMWVIFEYKGTVTYN